MASREDNLSEQIQETAALWLSRRDRGLSASEQDAYLEWLYAHPSHGRAILQQERVWTALNKLEQWRPSHSAMPNPDLLQPRRRVRQVWTYAGLVAAALLVAISVGTFASKSPDGLNRTAIIHPGPKKMALADGSMVELNQDAKIDVIFTADERHVRLLSGEAHFTVAHNAERPFFVDTGRVSVRAVGTAFSVALASNQVGVLVTEGKVQIMAQPTESLAPVTEEPASVSELPPPSESPVFLNAGQRVTVRWTPEAIKASAVLDVTPAEMDQALSWQAMRLEFVEMRLGDVVVEFNRLNRRKLTVGDANTAAILVGGNFRADNVEAFVRLLDTGFGITAFPHGDEIVLRKVE